MIMQDLVQDLIIKTNIFMSKSGQDINVRRDLIKSINAVTGEDSLDAIYVNDVDNFHIPDVIVMHIYNKDFNQYLMNPDLPDTCPFGYTIEIHKRCFKKYTAEELTSVIIHDILQNVQSDTAKIRFMAAYNQVISSYKTSNILDLFDDISHSEVVYIMLLEICSRPFRIPITDNDDVATDEVLRSMNLDDAYNSYLEKALQMSNDTIENRIETYLKDDFRDVEAIIDACNNKSIRNYYMVIKTGVPLITLEQVLGGKTDISLGFTSRKKAYKRRYATDEMSDKISPISESYNNPKNEMDIRFQIDKIITEMRYAETESERQVLLFKIYKMRRKLASTIKSIEDHIKKDPTNQINQHRLEYLKNYNDELDMLREKTIKMEIKKKVYGLFIKYPEGYEG